MQPIILAMIFFSGFSCAGYTNWVFFSPTVVKSLASYYNLSISHWRAKEGTQLPTGTQKNIFAFPHKTGFQILNFTQNVSWLFIKQKVPKCYKIKSVWNYEWILRGMETHFSLCGANVCLSMKIFASTKGNSSVR